MPAATSTAQQSNPFIKQLASSDRRIRDRALSSLRIYLRRSKPFAELDLLKLWKGLFFCMWMSDKPRNQQRLARDLADLIDVVRGTSNFLGFVDAFWKTMAREWSGIESLRMDKYLYLVRCYVNKGFEHVRQNHWADQELLRQYLEVLQSVPFNSRDSKIPNGLRFHVLDVFVDELDKVDTDRDAPLDILLAPLRRLEKDTVTKAVRSRVKEALEDERLRDWKATPSDGDSESNVDDDDDDDDDDDGVTLPYEGDEDNESDFGGFDD